MRKQIYGLLLLFVCINAYAAGGGDGIPVKMVIVQAINISMFLALVIYLVRPKIKVYFGDRKKNYLEYVNKAQKMKEEAEAQNTALKNKISKLKENNEAEISKAKSDAEQMRLDIIKQGQEIAVKMEADLNKSLKNELAMATTRLRADLIEASADSAREKMKTGLESADYKNMNNDFVKQLGAIN
ncbi:MAG: hypothetical protein AB8E15_03490 [Bdellovibrionales bacterium]